jgi:hypothetical protein
MSQQAATAVRQQQRESGPQAALHIKGQTACVVLSHCHTMLLSLLLLLCYLCRDQLQSSRVARWSLLGSCRGHIACM